MHLVEGITKYEEGHMNLGEVVELFQGLINTGVAWTLREHYKKTARGLIHLGLVTPSLDYADHDQPVGLEI